jgi:16S rRNA (guanine966-N2)-methyltransferase
MRIITGKYKGRNLASVPGRTTRPTTAYNREMLFSVYSDYHGKRVLDLFAGTGSYGLEALSRGAIWADFVEFASPAIAVLIKNINLLGCGADCHIWRKRVEAFLKDCAGTWDVIFLDPPYARDLVNPTLSMIYERGLLSTGATVIVEHSPLEPISAEFADRIIKSKTGKTSSFTLLGV